MIKLDHAEWYFDEDKPIGPRGGFGTVYLGMSPDGREVAVKRLNLDAKSLAHRELLISDKLSSRELVHVIPILDFGQDADSDDYFIVMPRAEKSLREYLLPKRQFDVNETVEILAQIVDGLIEVADIVHRDIKPENILFHDGRWKIADFGISRFIESATGSQTLRRYFSDAYAAPEEWIGARANSAADLYSVACVGFELLTGRAPFPGPERDDFARQHQNDAAPVIMNCPAHLQSLLSHLLRKSPSTRPNALRTADVLGQIRRGRLGQASSPGFARLAEIGEAEARSKAYKEAREEAERARERHRSQIAGEGVRLLGELRSQFLELIKDRASTLEVRIGQSDEVIARLLSGELRFPILTDPERPIAAGVFNRSGWDVIAWGLIQVSQDVETRPDYTRVSSSLWYTDGGAGSAFRWYEVGYTGKHQSGHYERNEPFHLNPEQAGAIDYRIETGATAQHAVAFGPVPIDDEDFMQFADRWAGTFAAAAKLQLRQYSHGSRT